MRRLRQRLTYSNVMSTCAVFVALGGSSYAALTVTGKTVKDSSLTGRDIRNGSLAGRDVRDRSLTGRDVRDASLLASDFAPNQLPAGPKGDRGERGEIGPVGPAGPTGIVANSFVWSADAVDLPTASTSLLSLSSFSDPERSGGTLALTRPSRLHAEAIVVLAKKIAGAGGAAGCAVYANDTAFSASSRTTFADAGNDPEGNPARPTVTLPIVGTLDVEPGTYDVSIHCYADRPLLAALTDAELHVTAYAR